MNTVQRARLVWAARAEQSRLHRLQVTSRRLEAEDRARLDVMDARIYRCPGCGDWRYACAGIRVTCAACGHRAVSRAA